MYTYKHNIYLIYETFCIQLKSGIQRIKKIKNKKKSSKRQKNGSNVIKKSRDKNVYNSRESCPTIGSKIFQMPFCALIFDEFDKNLEMSNRVVLQYFTRAHTQIWDRRRLAPGMSIREVLQLPSESHSSRVSWNQVFEDFINHRPRDHHHHLASPRAPK
ncbi:unnamed protein product [Nesidiocoris tenuis]|uniref:Uncharacterized protein n=1 Tax=Nesidiocoris tenuis TaxID=355587 RepID=A0A6H5GKK6_9HEMI|nr:unnamed protein product [Nesidiocoris tenuis]